MDQLTERIIQYFRTYLATHDTSPACDLHRHPLIGRALEDRLQRLLLVDQPDITEYVNPMINSRVLHLRTPDTLMAVAVYGEDQIWWLDDSRYDDDFVAFARREHLAEWLPTQPEELAAVMLATKFASTLKPRVITSADDIGANVDLDISPPQADHSADAKILRFWIWTESQGFVFAVRCYFRFDGTFYYELLEKASSVGKFTLHVVF